MRSEAIHAAGPMGRAAFGSALVLLAGLLAAAAPGGPAPAANGTDDPVDKALTGCLAKPGNDTTSGMLNCTDTAYKAYDRQLNDIYQDLIRKLDPTSRGRLQEAQRRWVAFRDAERRAQDAPWAADRGSMVSLEIAAANVDAVRERIRELRLYGPG